MHSDFVSLSLSLCLFSYPATFPNVFLRLSFSTLSQPPSTFFFLHHPFFCVLHPFFIHFHLLHCFFLLNSYHFLFLHLSFPFHQMPSSLLQSLSFSVLISSFHTSPPIFLPLSIPAPPCLPLAIYLCFCPSLPVTIAAVPGIRPLFPVAGLPPSPLHSLVPLLQRTPGRRCTALPLPPPTGRGNELPRQLCTV